jgi:hypothetical protein
MIDLLLSQVNEISVVPYYTSILIQTTKFKTYSDC